MSRKKKKSILHSRFYQIYFAVVLVVIIAMIIGRVWLGGVLKDYETSQPVYVAEEVARLFETGDYETIYRLDTAAEDIAGGDEAFYLESMEALSNGRAVEWTEGFSTDENEHRYNVTLDGEKFASFTLVPSGQTTGHGNTLWQLGSITTLVRVEHAPEPTEAPEEVEPEPEPTPAPPAGLQCRIQAPAGYIVSVDGEALSEANAQVTAKSVVPDNFLPQGVAPLTCLVYDYTAKTDAPQVTVTDASGAPQQVTQTGNAVWNCPLPGDATFQQQYSEAVFSLAKRIARVTARDASVSSMVGLCAKNSPARTIFDNYSNRWATPHSGADYRNQVVSDFYIHSQDCFTCHVTFDFVLQTSQGEQVYPTAYTFCIIREGSGAKLYNLMMQ